MTDEITSSYRKKAAYTASLTGILANVLLFIVKGTAGLMMNSAAVISDAFNNLMDSLSAVITLVSVRLASRPADKGHPFGHGRLEYMTGFVIALFIFITVWQLARESIVRILHPEAISMQGGMLVMLCLTVPVKLWLARFYRKTGEKIDSLPLKATALDAANDALITSITILSVFLNRFFPKIPFDGLASLLVSGFILKAGFDTAKDIFDKLMGTPVSAAMAARVSAIIREDERILGLHDLLLHDYGPDHMTGSGHAELDERLSLVEAHAIVDAAERRVEDATGIRMTLHMDPVRLADEETEELKEKSEQWLREHLTDIPFSIHDFRSFNNEVSFDLLLPYGAPFVIEEAQAGLGVALKKNVRITIDHEMIGD